MNEEPKQVLIAPKGTKFVSIGRPSGFMHIVPAKSKTALCKTEMQGADLSLITCYEEEVCSECLTASSELTRSTQKIVFGLA